MGNKALYIGDYKERLAKFMQEINPKPDPELVLKAIAKMKKERGL
ncbi:hypothetical protein BhaS171_00064 [Bacillus phage vB_BhaS-171]|nr:hypothetical protein BH781_gp64 [Bacillus phage vB_BhaS-171]ALY08120.1 hypothetical protein BhaS171_00064 [Bacillus phage vB_BhaS-171]